MKIKLKRRNDEYSLTWWAPPKFRDRVVQSSWCICEVWWWDDRTYVSGLSPISGLDPSRVILSIRGKWWLKLMLINVSRLWFLRKTLSSRREICRLFCFTVVLRTRTNDVPPSTSCSYKGSDYSTKFRRSSSMFLLRNWSRSNLCVSTGARRRFGEQVSIMRQSSENFSENDVQAKKKIRVFKTDWSVLTWDTW